MGIQQKGQTDYLPMSGQNKTQKSWAKKAHPTKVQPSSAKTRNKMVFASSLSQGKPNSRRYSLNFSMDKRLKECSTSTDVEPVHDVNKVTSPLQKAKRELENSENLKVTRKKRKKHNEKSEKKLEIKKLRESYEEMTETMKKLHDIILTRAEQPVRKPKKKEYRISECNYAAKEVKGDNDETLFVRGFDTYLPRHEIKSALRKHFSSCGKVTRVYVPIDCANGYSLGFAFIDLKEDHMKGLTLSGSDLGGWKLYVTLAKHRMEFHSFYNFKGCKRCHEFNPTHADFCKNYYGNFGIRLNPWIYGSPFSKFGRFTANICRLYGKCV